MNDSRDGSYCILILYYGFQVASEPFIVKTVKQPYHPEESSFFYMPDCSCNSLSREIFGFLDLDYATVMRVVILPDRFPPEYQRSKIFFPWYRFLIKAIRLLLKTECPGLCLIFSSLWHACH